MIELKQVSKYYNNFAAVDHISFKVEEGQTVVLLGKSGCGKTTTLRMVNRLIEPGSGTIEIAGENITAMPPQQLRRGIGYVLQHTGLFPHYTVAENISTVPRLMKWNESKIADRVNELLQKLDLDPAKVASLYPAQLSGGQQQRVGLARALAANPPVLLMDEPFGALDPVTRAGIRKEFRQLDELKRKTVLMVTHDVQEAFEMADVVCLMDKGKIVQMGTPTDLLFRPAHPFVTNFFAGQSFLLGLQALTIADIWSHLPNAVNRDGARFVDPGTNLFTAFELLSQPNPSSTRFYTEQDEQVKEVSLQQLLSGYTSKQNTSHE